MAVGGIYVVRKKALLSVSVVFPGKKLFYYEVEDPEQEGF